MRTLFTVAAVVGCTDAVDVDPIEPVDYTRAGTVLPDFALVDVNATSPTGGQEVTVASQRGRVSAWYFGHST